MRAEVGLRPASAVTDLLWGGGGFYGHGQELGELVSGKVVVGDEDEQHTAVWQPRAKRHPL